MFGAYEEVKVSVAGKGKYSKLIQRTLELKQLANQMKRDDVPYKAKVKRAASQNPFVRKDNEELSRHAGSSRSVVLDAIKAIAHKETGCRLATDAELVRIRQSARNANTTQGNYVLVVQH